MEFVGSLSIPPSPCLRYWMRRWRVNNVDDRAIKSIFVIILNWWPSLAVGLKLISGVAGDNGLRSGQVLLVKCHSCHVSRAAPFRWHHNGFIGLSRYWNKLNLVQLATGYAVGTWNGRRWWFQWKELHCLQWWSRKAILVSSVVIFQAEIKSIVIWKNKKHERFF